MTPILKSYSDSFDTLYYYTFFNDARIPICHLKNNLTFI